MRKTQTAWPSKHPERAAPLGGIVLPEEFAPKRYWRIELGALPPGHWKMGADSVCGPVRKENEDFLVSIVRPDSHAIVFADGCGGLPYGAAASRQAAITAASILASDASLPSGTLVQQCFAAARYSLSRLGRTLGAQKLSDGLRTTLVVVIASGATLDVGFIGDGACDVLCPNGEIGRLLVPQRVDASSLAASLGPTLHGEPEIFRVPRPEGSFVFCGTDGVFDRVSAAGFHQAVIGRAIHLEGRLDLAVHETLGYFAEAQNETGFICDDNMTLAVLGQGVPPKLLKGFWNHAPH